MVRAAVSTSGDTDASGEPRVDAIESVTGASVQDPKYLVRTGVPIAGECGLAKVPIDR